MLGWLQGPVLLGPVLRAPLVSGRSGVVAAMRKIEKVTVYASSSARIHDDHFVAARRLGELIAKEGWIQVNGGGKTGLMGAATEGGLEAGGIVDAVIIDMFTEVNMHPQLRNVQVEKTMPERKKGLYDVADAFFVLPGGLGTLEEMAEILAWRQLQLHSKAIVLVNTRGYYDHFKAFVDHSIDEGFVTKEFRSILKLAATPEEAVEIIKAYEPTELDKEKVWSGSFGDKREEIDSDWKAAAAQRAKQSAPEDSQ